MDKPSITQEIDRIRRVYAKRSSTIPKSRYSFFDEAALFAFQSRERALLDLLKSSGFGQLEDTRILDIGCGNGELLRSFIRYGADPSHLFGIDLLPDRIEDARRLSPEINFRCGSAHRLPFESRAFDIVSQFTAFTSILDRPLRRSIAEEMLRVLNKGGMIIWFDFMVNNPRNNNVRGMKRPEIESLFPGCAVYLNRVLLAPPLARSLASRSLIFCYLLQSIPWLCTHYLGTIRRCAKSCASGPTETQRG
jgi:SAM-dependent methyltransferase